MRTPLAGKAYFYRLTTQESIQDYVHRSPSTLACLYTNATFWHCPHGARNLQ